MVALAREHVRHSRPSATCQFERVQQQLPFGLHSKLRRTQQSLDHPTPAVQQGAASVSVALHTAFSRLTHVLFLPTHFPLQRGAAPVQRHPGRPAPLHAKLCEPIHHTMFPCTSIVQRGAAPVQRHPAHHPAAGGVVPQGGGRGPGAGIHRAVSCVLILGCTRVRPGCGFRGPAGD